MLNLLIFNAMSVNFVEFIIGLLFIVATAILVILITGIIYTKDGYISVIEKKHKFHKIEKRKFSFYFPIIYRKALYLSLDQNKIMTKNNKAVYYRVIDAKKLYESKVDLQAVVDEEDHLQERLEEIGIKLIFKGN